MDKIGKFYIIGIKMQGFKCFKEEYSANLDMLTYIAGANGKGKTSIAEAAAFAFCGTGFYGKRSCDKLLNVNSQQMRVEIELVDGNGEIHSLIRTRKGSETSISLDGIPLRQADMNTVFAEKDIFLSMFNPLYFIEKIAEDGKEFLEKLLPVLKQEDIVSHLPDSTKAVLENQSLIDPEYFIKNRRGELKELNENDTYLSGQTDLLKSQRDEAVGKIDSVLEGINKIVEELYNLLVYDYIYTDEEADRILNCRGNIFEHLYTEWLDCDCSHRDEFVDAAAEAFKLLP